MLFAGACKVAFIITEPCVSVKDTACVDSCPVDRIPPRSDEQKSEGEDLTLIQKSVLTVVLVFQNAPWRPFFQKRKFPSSGSSTLISTNDGTRGKGRYTNRRLALERSHKAVSLVRSDGLEIKNQQNDVDQIC